MQLAIHNTKEEKTCQCPKQNKRYVSVLEGQKALSNTKAM